MSAPLGMRTVKGLPPPPQRTVAAGSIICPNPNCGLVAPPERKARGSTVLLVALFLCAVLPGLIYLSLRGGYRYHCRRCGVQVATDA